MELHQQCDAIWKAITVGEPVRKHDEDRQSDGNYVSGFRDITDTWTRSFDDLVAKASLTQWRTFSLSADQSGSRRNIEIRRGDEVLFAAIQVGAVQTERFSGADERYVGSEATAGQQWQITQGDVTRLPATMTPE